MPFEENEAGSMEGLRPSRTSFSEDPGLRRVQAAQEFGAALSRLITPELLKLPDWRLFPSRWVWPCSAPSRREHGRHVDLAARAELRRQTREVLAGDISVVSIAEILQLLDLHGNRARSACSPSTAR